MRILDALIFMSLAVSSLAACAGPRTRAVPPTVQRLSPRDTVTRIAEEPVRHMMITLRDREQECYTRYGVSGSGTVDFTVDNAGRVEQVGLSPPLAGTPSGNCL